VKTVLYPYCQTQVIEKLQKQPFSLLVDESTDISDNKILNLNVRFFDAETQNITTKLLYLEKIIDYSSAGMLETIRKRMEKLDISLDWMISFIAERNLSWIIRSNLLLPLH
jgi:phosphoribosylamine-glycine ligase